MNDDDRMPVPLYHGTSRLFLPSIRSRGLGAQDPNVTFRSREMLDELASAREWSWYEDPDLLSIRYIADQRVTGGGFNFRHGRTYLSPSKTTAVRYALGNRFGSELLSTTLRLFEKLQAFDQRSAHEIISRYPELLQLSTSAHQPLLVEVWDIPIRHLRSEDGGDPSDSLRIMGEEADDLRELLWQQLNFELTAPQPAVNLKLYRIEPTNTDPIFPQYSLTLEH